MCVQKLRSFFCFCCCFNLDVSLKVGQWHWAKVINICTKLIRFDCKVVHHVSYHSFDSFLLKLYIFPIFQLIIGQKITLLIIHLLYFGLYSGLALWKNGKLLKKKKERKFYCNIWPPCLAVPYSAVHCQWYYSFFFFFFFFFLPFRHRTFHAYVVSMNE